MLIDTKDPNVIGEHFRNLFFKTKDGEKGCYDTFILNDNVVQLPYRVIWFDPTHYSDLLKESYEVDISRYQFPIKNDDVLEVWTRAQLGDVIMEYYWDGDGILRFILPDMTVINTDCKKTNRWEIECLD